MCSSTFPKRITNSWLTARVPSTPCRYRDNIFFKCCDDLCEHGNLSSFESDHTADSLASFEAVVREVFGREAHGPKVLRLGMMKGLLTFIF